jgi:hypothetical protein
VDFYHYGLMRTTLDWIAPPFVGRQLDRRAPGVRTNQMPALPVHVARLVGNRRNLAPASV